MRGAMYSVAELYLLEAYSPTDEAVFRVTSHALLFAQDAPIFNKLLFI